METKRIKKLNKAYKKRFNKHVVDLFTNNAAGVLLFLEYLKYIRDQLVLRHKNVSDSDDYLKLVSLISAIAELEVYYASNTPEQKEFHWGSFCENIKQNMEEWLSLDDSIQKSSAT